MRGYKKKNIIKITEEHNSSVEDAVADEKMVRILVNGKDVLKFYCSPIMVRELVVGFMMTEGIIQGEWCMERMSIQYEDDIIVDIPAAGVVSLEGSARTSGCVGGITFERTPECGTTIGEGITIHKDTLKEVFQKFQKSSELYNMTGCMHSAAISDGRHLLVLAEDIGRHNAVDKAIGYCILEKIPLHDKIILVSGRLSSEMASKCSRWGIPVVVSRAAPTALSIDIAEKRGITMIGFMRGQRMNIYTHPERIIR
ncbi:MAG: formate dehydrogenase accessory sulfurtransferase FdhD [Nitrospiraceae bacterium]|nr:MAG: formate dehydrogenase accessory sulfurtransferase FdhD [Nitrospiraceae bacterium]